MYLIVIVPYFMIKSFLILLIFPIFLFSSQQIILVIADDFNTSKASLEFFEDTKILLTTQVNLGKNGLGWGIGEIKFKHPSTQPIKHEGDKKAPAGVFKLTNIFGYAHANSYKLPYLYASKKLICVDDSNSKFYNRIIQAHGDEKSFEFMRRKDNQYKYGVTVAHNPFAVAGQGSCIFLHIQREENHPTVGCTSMDEKSLKKIISLLDAKKNPLLIQLPKNSLKQILLKYPQLNNSHHL